MNRRGKIGRKLKGQTIKLKDQRTKIKDLVPSLDTKYYIQNT